MNKSPDNCPFCNQALVLIGNHFRCDCDFMYDRAAFTEKYENCYFVHNNKQYYLEKLSNKFELYSCNTTTFYTFIATIPLDFVLSKDSIDLILNFS